MLTFEAYNLSGGQYKKIFGNTLGSYCDFIYDKLVETEVRAGFAKSNISVAYGDCPIPAQTVEVFDYAPGKTGKLVPPYMPGN